MARRTAKANGRVSKTNSKNTW